MSEPEQKPLLDRLTEDEATSITKIIISLASKFSQRFPFLVADDLIQEGWKELIRYQSYFDPAKGKITSWVYMVAHDIFTSIAQKEYNKTQKWDPIEGLSFSDNSVILPDHACAYGDMMKALKQALSPQCFRYLCELEKNPKVCFSDLSKILGLSDRDLSYLRDELRLSTEHVLGEKYG